jgi:AbrB family looped-hinge helix DNA binding protein
MIKSKVSKNGMINLPVKIRQKLNIVPGDEISFVEEDGQIHIVPIRNILDLPDQTLMPKTIELIEELIEEHRNEKW